MIEAAIIGASMLGVAGGVLVLAFRALSAEKRAGEQKARADALDVNLTGLAAQLADMTNRHREEKERADRIEDAMATVAAGPVAGAHERMLRAIAAARAARGDGARVVSTETAAPLSHRGDTRLLDPWSESE